MLQVVKTWSCTCLSCSHSEEGSLFNVIFWRWHQWETKDKEASTPAGGRLPALRLQTRPPPGASWPRSWVSPPGAPGGPRTKRLHRTGSQVAGVAEEGGGATVPLTHPALWGCWSRRGHWRKEVTSSWRWAAPPWYCCCCLQQYGCFTLNICQCWYNMTCCLFLTCKETFDDCLKPLLYHNITKKTRHV